MNHCRIIYSQPWLSTKNLLSTHTANILTVLSTAFGSVTFPTVIWLHILQPNIALSLKLYSSKSVTVMCTTNGCTKYSFWQCYVSHCNLAVNICSVQQYFYINTTKLFFKNVVGHFQITCTCLPTLHPARHICCKCNI